MPEKHKSTDFVHLHLHSEYSLLDGACRIYEIPKAAKDAGQTAVALTDHGVMYGVVDFYKACMAEGIKPIIGCEVYVAARTMNDRDHEFDSKSNHLVLLVKNSIGYKNLIYMVSKSFSEGFYSKPRIDLAILEAHSEGLCALSACLAGYIPRHILLGDYEGAKEYALKLQSIFEENSFYLEVQNHGINEQYTVNEGILRIHYETGIPIVATNDVHYIKKDDALVHSVLMCIQTGKKLSEGRPIGFESDEFYFKSTNEMYELFGDYPEAITNTAKIAEMCNFDFEFGKIHLPSFSPESGEAPVVYLRKLVFSGLKDRVSAERIHFTDEHPEQEYLDRIEYELSIINSMGYTEYYLIVWDFVNYSKNHDIMVGPGRGSGAGSLCAFLIGIVDVDPIVYGLLFERFLNPERVSMPDFDIDFPDGKRDQVIEYVRDKYGADCTSQIITFGTMAAKAAMKDVRRVLDVPFGEIDAACAALPQEKDVSLKDALNNSHFRKMYDESENVKRTVDIALRIEGMPRHASVHAAGVVIADGPLFDDIPLAVNNGITVTQFAMKNIEELGFLKFDFLAIRYLTIIESCVNQILEHCPSFRIDEIDLSDIDTYAMISKGDTDGVFQLEKGGMKRFLTQLKPMCFDDIISAISFYRPGPMDSIPKFLNNREHPEEITYVSPLLEPILSSTSGCIVFQEQVMRIFQTLAGYSFGKADIVRRAISKKKIDVLESERKGFVDGAQLRGLTEEDATVLFDEIVKFAEYAYNKSHATAYAIMTYRTAFLKCHYPLEYTCALLSSVMSNTGKVAEYISEARSRGIIVLPPSVNDSGVDFHAVDGKILFGLDAVRNLGKNTAQSIVKEVKKNGKFKSVEDFITRIDKSILNKRQLEFLIKSGALDCLGIKRRQLMSIIDDLSVSPTLITHNELEGQVDLFDVPEIADGTDKIKLPELPDVPDFTSKELLSLEKESIGIYLSGHVLDDYSDHISDIKPVSIAEIVRRESSLNENVFRDGAFVTLCVIITGKTEKISRDGNSLTFLKVEDATGECEIIVFSKNNAEYKSLFFVDNAIKVLGKISKKEDDLKIILESAEPLKMNITENGLLESTEKSDIEQSKSEFNMEIDRDCESLIKKIYIKMDLSDEKLKSRVFNLISIFDEGHDYALFYDISKGTYDRNTVLRCKATSFLINQLKELVGESCVVLR